MNPCAIKEIIYRNARFINLSLILWSMISNDFISENDIIGTMV